MFVRELLQLFNVAHRHHSAATNVMGRLQTNQLRDSMMNIRAIPDASSQSFQVERAIRFVWDNSGHDPRQRRDATLFVLVNVAQVTHDRLCASGSAVHSHAQQISHRARRHQHRAFFSCTHTTDATNAAICAANASSAFTVGSSPSPSSPTTALTMASFIASVGVVTVSLRMSMTGPSPAGRQRILSQALGMVGAGAAKGCCTDCALLESPSPSAFDNSAVLVVPCPLWSWTTFASFRGREEGGDGGPSGDGRRSLRISATATTASSTIARNESQATLGHALLGQ
eukprot:GHVT01028055.1.p1 GENE.GHVT01028055.1~~GHVT01028055.1.p1  ORF type:complete len:285 (-),score=43.50 GHVT01028055.1:106-960(-)